MLMQSKQLDGPRQLPVFSRIDVSSGELILFPECLGTKATVLAFMCNHCPYVKHILASFVNLANQWHGEEFFFVALSANDADQYPQDSPEQMKLLAQQMQFRFPYLYDQSQELFRSLDIVCTPEFMVVDPEGSALYHGRYDETTPGSGQDSHGKDLVQVLEAIKSGRQIPVSQPSMGCSVKWK